MGAPRDPGSKASGVPELRGHLQLPRALRRRGIRRNRGAGVRQPPLRHAVFRNASNLYIALRQQRNLAGYEFRDAFASSSMDFVPNIINLSVVRYKTLDLMCVFLFFFFFYCCTRRMAKG
ncbi:unnamed protein product [Ixodes pacificus]